jgi:hypothetical protein
LINKVSRPKMTLNNCLCIILHAKRRFLMKSKIGIVIATTLVLLLLVAGISYAQGYPQPGLSTSNTVVQNMATGSGQVATLIVSYYSTDGVKQYENTTVKINPKSVKEIKAEDEPLPAGFSGAAVVSSDQPIAAVVSIKNTNVPEAPDGFTQGAYNGTSTAGTSTSIFFPTVWGFNGIVSRVTVQNAEAGTNNIKLDFYDRSGNFLGSSNEALNAYGSRTYYLGNTSDLPSGWPSGFQDGSITITSTDNKMLAGASTATWPNRAGAYQALSPNDQGTVLYAPSHYRFKQNPSDSEYTLFSAVNIQNTSSSTTAQVKVEYFTRGDNSGTPALTLNTTIPPLSARGLNTKNGGDLDASVFDPLGTSWDGSVTITSENDVPLVGTGITNWGVAGNAGIYALVSDTSAADTIFIPAQYRLAQGSTWNQWSALNLQNVGTTTVNAADLTVEYIDTNGNTIKTFTGAQLPGNLAPGAAFGLNTRNGGDLAASAFDSFGTSFIGGIYITGPAGSDLVAVSNIIYKNRASVYNGFPE